jgi:hypothetical protein
MSWMTTLMRQTYQPLTLPDWSGCLQSLSGNTSGALDRLVYRTLAYWCNTPTNKDATY